MLAGFSKTSKNLIQNLGNNFRKDRLRSTRLLVTKVERTGFSRLKTPSKMLLSYHGLLVYKKNSVYIVETQIVRCSGLFRYRFWRASLRQQSIAKITSRWLSSGVINTERYSHGRLTNAWVLNRRRSLGIFWSNHSHTRSASQLWR